MLKEEVILIEEAGVGRPGRGDTGIPGGSLTTVRPVEKRDVLGRAEIMQTVRFRGRRPVVDDDQLIGRQGLVPDTFDGSLQKTGAVVERDENGDTAGPGGRIWRARRACVMSPAEGALRMPASYSVRS
jgi:hypothetical protein